MSGSFRPSPWLAAALMATLVGCTGQYARQGNDSRDAAANRSGAKAAGAKRSGQMPPLSDAELKVAVQTELGEQRGVSRSISVAVKDGIVMLQGTVDNAVVARRLEDGIENIRGVRAVVSRLDVVAPIIEDARLESAIERALKDDPALEGRPIKVSVRRGRVVLAGTVDSYAEREIASDTAWFVRGVTYVENRMTLRVGEQRSDSEIESDIERRVSIDARLREQDLSVEVSRGVATLRGEVRSAAQRRRARLLAWVQGVRSVNVEGLSVNPERRGAASQRQVLALGNADVAAAVRDALRYDPRVPNYGIDVQARDGEVTLRGSVGSIWAQRAAEQDALGTVGVRRVHNLLRVEAKVVLSDSEVEDAVRQRLANHPSITVDDIEPSVQDGVVVLRGSADSAFESQQVERATAEVRGVAAVRNELIVSERMARVRDDRALERELQQQLGWDQRIDASRVHISVRDGTVTVEGLVPDWEMYDAVLERVYGQLPRGVVNRLERERLPQRPSEQ